VSSVSNSVVSIPRSVPTAATSAMKSSESVACISSNPTTGTGCQRVPHAKPSPPQHARLLGAIQALARSEFASFAGDFPAAPRSCGVPDLSAVCGRSREFHHADGPEVMKPIGRLRLLFAVEAERGEIGTRVDAVPGKAAEA
jgi:hypothetical protein